MSSQKMIFALHCFTVWPDEMSVNEMSVGELSETSSSGIFMKMGYADKWTDLPKDLVVDVAHSDTDTDEDEDEEEDEDEDEDEDGEEDEDEDNVDDDASKKELTQFLEQRAQYVHSRNSIGSNGTRAETQDKDSSSGVISMNGHRSCNYFKKRGMWNTRDGKYYVVTDPNDDDAVNPRPGTLRYAVIQDEPLWIIFKRSMVITLKQELIMNSFKTIDARGHCELTKSWLEDIWADHNSLSNCPDGLVDAVMGSTAITISNNYFTHHNEVILLGHSDSYTRDKVMQVTIAYNHFGEGLIQRMPRCRHGYFHGNRYLAPNNPFAKEVTKRLEVGAGALNCRRGRRC
ncbi:hypothetical protein POM88_052866 [Heracleum sosnowskyi]|uniref:Pectate lyase n=1 Tax=Heracleum sosnowskyi TaxID=360622 RepID=A0AAD8LYF0_9APIA|nr:hypothetical protein POM88_052866 [Heracleum sosnowskyi]